VTYCNTVNSYGASRDDVVGIDIKLHAGKLMNLNYMPIGLRNFFVLRHVITESAFHTTPLKWVMSSSFLKAIRPGHDDGRSPTPSVKVENEKGSASTPQYTFTAFRGTIFLSSTDLRVKKYKEMWAEESFLFKITL